MVLRCELIDREMKVADGTSPEATAGSKDQPTAEIEHQTEDSLPKASIDACIRCLFPSCCC